MENPHYLKASDIALKLNVSERQVKWMARTGVIPSVRMGRKTIRFHWPSVEEALANREAKTQPQNWSGTPECGE